MKSKELNLTPEEKAKRKARRAKRRLERLLFEMRKDVAKLYEMIRRL